MDVDAGIEDDFDFLKEEEEFYKSQRENREKCGNFGDRSDSALSISTPRLPPPPILKEYNYPKNVDQVRTFTRETIKSVQLANIDLSERRLRNEHLYVTKEKIVLQLIDFVDIEKRFISCFCTNTRDPPLFIFTEGFATVNNEYYFEAVRKYCTKRHADILHYLANKVGQVCAFIERINNQSTMSIPNVILAIREWAAECINKYGQSLEMLRREKIKEPILVVERLQELGTLVEIVHKLLKPHLKKTSVWKPTDVEEVWIRFFTLTQSIGLMDEKQKSLLADLQERLLHKLLSTMDSIYETASLPAMETFFFFIPNTEAIEPPIIPRPELAKMESLLWDKELIDIVVKGAMARVMASRKDLIEGDFTETFMKILKRILKQEDVNLGETLIEFGTFQEAFLETAIEEKRKLDQKIVECLRKDNDLNEFWEDLESIVIGAVAVRHSMIVLNTNIQLLNLYEVFWMSLRCEKTIRNEQRFLWTPSTKLFGCKLEKPLGYFIDNQLIGVMNECRQISHNLHRTIELLLMIQRDKMYTTRLYQSRSESSEGFHGLAVDERRESRTIRLKLRHVAFTTHQIVSYFKELFNCKVRSVFSEKAKIFASPSLTLGELNAAMKDAHSQFFKLVERVGVRRRAHETMERYSKMVEELQLKLISNSITIDYLDKCEAWISTSIQIFNLMSKQFGNDHANVFYIMCVKIGKQPTDYGQRND